MASYRVLKRSYIDTHLREEGDIVEYDGTPGRFLEPLDVDEDEAPKPKARRAKAEDDGGALA